MRWRWLWLVAVVQGLLFRRGCQFTSADFVGGLQAEVIKISWSGRRSCYVNILFERLWRKLKYEEVYLNAYSDGWEAGIGWLDTYGGMVCKTQQLPGGHPPMSSTVVLKTFISGIG